jgi:chromosome segregation ATPase
MLPESPDVTSYRLDKLEEGVAALRGDFKEAIGTLNAGITALQAQLNLYQTNMADKYMTRREARETVELANATHKAQEDRLNQQRDRIDQLADQIQGNRSLIESSFKEVAERKAADRFQINVALFLGGAGCLGGVLGALIATHVVH